MPQKMRTAAKKRAREAGKPKIPSHQDVEPPLAAKRQRAKSVILWSAVVLGLTLAVWGMIKITSRPEPEPSRLSDQSAVGGWSKGNPSARITIIEYSDFECTACARYYGITKRLSHELGDDFKIIFRHFPIIPKHANAVLAAKTAEAAGLQGKFWEMHDMLFEKQKEWSERKKEEVRTIFVRYAVALNLNVPKFKNDLDSQEVSDRVTNDARTGRNSGVKNTPTFFLNGEKITNKPYSYETFKDLILKTKDHLS